MQKLWLGNEIAEFEQNFEDLEITKPLQADEATVEILTQALLGNIDEVMPDSIDRAFIRFLISIVGITEEELPDQVGSGDNFRTFATSSSPRMMTLTSKVSGDKKLLIKGSFNHLYRQCTYYINDEGTQCKIDNDTRDRIKCQIEDAMTESNFLICICYKDISQDDLKPQVQNHDSGGGAFDEDFEEFLSDQADLTLVAVALFKNPVNIWIPSCISKIHKAQVKTLLVSSSENGTFYAKECGIMNEGNENEEIDAKEFYEKAQNNRFWLEHHIHHIKVMSKASAIHKYYLTDCLLNLNQDTMVVSNKPDDLPSIRRAQIGISCSEVDNSCLFEDSSILLSKRGFLEVYNLFKYATYMEICTKDSYVFCISSILIMALLSLLFAIVRGDTLFQPVHYLIMLTLETVLAEYLFKTIIDSDEIPNEQVEEEGMSKGYSLDEKTRNEMRYHIAYTVLIPIFIFLFNFMPSEAGYYYNPKQLEYRVENTIPQLQSFIFIFVLVSRMCAILSFR